MNIILFGPPGAGKGTQADNIVKSFNLFKVSSGDLLRDEISRKTDLGNQIKSIITKGSFVSDDVINKLIEKILSDMKYFNKLVFDGYPRNLDQAKNLDTLIKKYNQKISCVISLNVDKEIVIKRILGRQTCTKCGLIFNEYFKPSNTNDHSCESKFLVKRSDDNEEIIVKRYETYLEKTLPILTHYKRLNLLHEIEGKTGIDQIFAKITHIIASLEG